jgi:hypothetical protein
MTFRLFIGFAALLCTAASGLVGTVLWFEMVDKVNQQLPASEQFGHLVWWFPTSHRVVREYKKLYPNGDLLRKRWILSALALACLFLCAWCFGFFWP